MSTKILILSKIYLHLSYFYIFIGVYSPEVSLVCLVVSGGNRTIAFKINLFGLDDCYF